MSRVSSGCDFNNTLPSFTDCSGVTEDENFSVLPDDHVIFVTDVVDFTGAIEQGRYKDVNTNGAAAIAAVQNALGRCGFPYVFGGDGGHAVAVRKLKA